MPPGMSVWAWSDMPLACPYNTDYTRHQVGHAVGMCLQHRQHQHTRRTCRWHVPTTPTTPRHQADMPLACRLHADNTDHTGRTCRWHVPTTPTTPTTPGGHAVGMSLHADDTDHTGRTCRWHVAYTPTTPTTPVGHAVGVALRLRAQDPGPSNRNPTPSVVDDPIFRRSSAISIAASAASVPLFPLAPPARSRA